MKTEKIIEQIDELKQKIEELEKEVNSPEFEGIKKGVRWEPQFGDKYFYLSGRGFVHSSAWTKHEYDFQRFNLGNCFKTGQEAIDYKENLLTKQALKDLALELNEGVEIDWDCYGQDKFYIFLDFDSKYFLNSNYVFQFKGLGNVYCLNKDFLSIAKERIGEEKLIKLFESGV